MIRWRRSENWTEIGFEKRRSQEMKLLRNNACKIIAHVRQSWLCKTVVNVLRIRILLHLNLLTSSTKEQKKSILSELSFIQFWSRECVQIKNNEVEVGNKIFFFLYWRQKTRYKQTISFESEKPIWLQMKIIPEEELKKLSFKLNLFRNWCNLTKKKIFISATSCMKDNAWHA